MKIKIKSFDALILDMDGVFVDTEPRFFKAFRKVFNSIDIDDEYLHRMIGFSMEQNLKDIAADFILNFDIPSIKIELEKAYIFFVNEKSLFPNEGIVQLLSTAKSHQKKIALCTSSSRNMFNMVFEKISSTLNTKRAEDFFDIVVTGKDVQNKKPHPEPYLKTAALLKVEPSRCIVVEDTHVGVESAKSAGCVCIALRREYNRHQDFSNADGVIDQICDIQLLTD